MDKNSCYKMAHELNGPVRQVIDQYHPHLKDAKIACLFRKGSWRVKDRVQQGRALVAPPVWESLTGYELLLIVNEGVYLGFSEEERVAQLDHILSFIKEPVYNKNGTLSYSTRDCDIQEHSGVVNRHKVCFSNIGAIDEYGSRQLDIKSLEKQASDSDLKGAVAAEETLDAQDEEEEDIIVIEEHESEDELEGEVIRKFEFGA